VFAAELAVAALATVFVLAAGSALSPLCAAVVFSIEKH
jgi:hypothetical protein